MNGPHIWIARRWFSVRIGRRYFKLRDLRHHPLLYTERHGIGHRRLFRVGTWEMGVRL